MPANRPRAIPRRPQRTQVSEDAVQALEARLEAEERGQVATPKPPPEPKPPKKPKESAVSQVRETASLQARQGTMATPHVRRDGQQTRSTTIHFPVDLHQELRLRAATDGRRISEIVTEAVSQWLADSNR